MRISEFIDDYVGPIVYHGSKTPDLTLLEPRPSKLATDEVVFAATLFDVAIAMSGGWTDDDFEFGRDGQEVNGHFVRYKMRELRPGAFDEFFNDRVWVYLLSSDGFKTTSSLQDFELVSTEAVEPISFIEIENALDTLHKSGVVKVIEYRPQSPLSDSVK